MIDVNQIKEEEKMKNSRRVISLCLAIAMVAGVLTGCGDNGENSNPSSSNPSSNPGSNTSQSSTEPEQPAQTYTGTIIDATQTADKIESEQHSVLNYAIENDCLDFDPFTFNTGANEAFGGLYQTLAYMIDGEVVSAVLKDYSFSDDGLTFSFDIYDYITDSEGNHITASDIVFCYNMAEEYASLGMKGYVESFTATGDYTCEVKLTQELGIGKLDKLIKFYVVSEKAYEEHDMHSDPIGTGPYVMTKHESGYSFTYEKRDDYWQTDDTQRSARDMANVDVINFYVIAESAQRTIALQNGSVDASVGISAEDLDTFDQSEDYWLAAVPDDLSMTLAPNCDPSHLTSDVNLRKAIFYGISNEAILQSVYGGRGTALHDWCPNWAVGYNLEWDNETDNYYTFDLEKAKEYLEQSSYAGETLTLLTSNDSTSSDVATMIRNMLEQVGIDVKITALDGTIVRQNYADVTAWDLYLTNNATNTYWVDGINGYLTTDKTTWDGAANFWYEQDLQDMLVEYMQTENATAENFEVLRDYFIENALGMGIVNPVTYIVMPSWCTGVCMSFKKTLTPGGSTYLAG